VHITGSSDSVSRWRPPWYRFDGWQPAPTQAGLEGSDHLAFGVVTAARQPGLRGPDDLSVIGIDGHDFREIAGLTTMALQVVQMGARRPP